ncbi:TetR/AcrR family transcriptional regulator [Staphylococcus xylosus]|uniref:TetR/AcrR family transcriptional regulator n=1 Tax=Staphylococcus xylosus TaxID=1288 RepID=UPI002041203B|nr:TetR/AcrR family transcriptional regulator [Staphylococcus xylosus]MCM3519826.1 TetR/AcrR family transcriptional regulator [Staphylococcus xylosus]
MSNKDIQKQRMWQYFIDATTEIIEEKGIDNVTIREIADKAGYNSATIYNYFQEVSHLIFFAALKYLNKFINQLPNYMEEGKTSLEQYLLSWKSFCEHSFREPEIYYSIFLKDLGNNPEQLLKHYYEVYQSNLFGEVTEDIHTFITDYNYSTRSRNALNKSIEDGLLNKDEARKVNEKTVLLWQGMLISLLNNRRHLNVEQATQITMDYIKDIIELHKVK